MLAPGGARHPAGGRAGSENEPGCPAVSGADADPGVALRAARADRDSVVDLTRQLVRLPSRAGIDPYEPVLGCMSAWLGGHGLRPRQLSAAGGETVAMVCEITGGRAGPRYVLDACLDTAPFGDEAAWTYSPTSGLRWMAPSPRPSPRPCAPMAAVP